MSIYYPLNVIVNLPKDKFFNKFVNANFIVLKIKSMGERRACKTTTLVETKIKVQVY